MEEHLVRALKESRMELQRLHGENEKLLKELSDTSRRLKESEEGYLHLRIESETDKEELSYIKIKESIERYLIKEAYSFLRSEGYTYNYKINLWQRSREENEK